MTTTIGELCMGYGGLGMGLSLALGGDTRVAWAVEYDKHPSAIISHRYPGVPNYGDVKTAPWSQMEPVDWLTAGYPCQPFSHAGLRKGADDPRHLWPGVAHAISVLRPRNVLLENVRGHLRLGFSDVLGDLAALGYDARWGLVRAADAGAPHNRARLFVVATDTEHDGQHGTALRRGAVAGEGVRRLREPQGSPADPRVAAPDARGERHGRGEDARGLGRLDRADEDGARERQRTRGESVDRGAAPPAHAEGERLRNGQGQAGAGGGRLRSAYGDLSATDADWAGSAERGHAASDAAAHPAAVVAAVGPEWGAYAPAIARWAAVTGRPAPRPTEPGRRGERLSPRFVEWMMGLPEGWVTDVPGLPRNAQLKALGNGVVPQQAALACRLLGVTAEAVAA